MKLTAKIIGKLPDLMNFTCFGILHVRNGFNGVQMYNVVGEINNENVNMFLMPLVSCICNAISDMYIPYLVLGDFINLDLLELDKDILHREILYSLKELSLEPIGINLVSVSEDGYYSWFTN